MPSDEVDTDELERLRLLRLLNGKGCLYGQNIRRDLDRYNAEFTEMLAKSLSNTEKTINLKLKERDREMEETNKRLRKLTQVGVGLLVSITVAAIGLVFDIFRTYIP